MFKHPPEILNGRGMSKREQSNHEKPAQVCEDCKEQHLEILSKLHDDVQPWHKEMRTRLNALKKRGSMKKKMPENFDDSMIPKSWFGGKAGKLYFVVKVCDVQNLYKTTKPITHTSQTERSMWYTGIGFAWLHKRGCNCEG